MKLRFTQVDEIWFKILNKRSKLDLKPSQRLHLTGIILQSVANTRVVGNGITCRIQQVCDSHEYFIQRERVSEATSEFRPTTITCALCF